VPVLFEARHRGAVTCHMSFVDELPTHGAPEGGVVRTEAGALYPPLKFLLVGELDIGEGCVLCVERQIRPV
jgi:hypothetical protein